MTNKGYLLASFQHQFLGRLSISGLCCCQARKTRSECGRVIYLRL